MGESHGKTPSLLCLTVSWDNTENREAGQRRFSDVFLWSLQLVGFGNTKIIMWQFRPPKMFGKMETETNQFSSVA